MNIVRTAAIRAALARGSLMVASCIIAAVLATNPAAARTGLLDAINAVRAEGCGGEKGVHAPLLANRKLDSVARRISRGAALPAALSAAGYRARHSSFSMFVSRSGGNDGIAQILASRSCAQLRDESVRDIGIERRGEQVWIVLAAPFDASALTNAAVVSQRILELTNDARARAQRCGAKSFAPAPALTLAPLLSDAARRHSQDMARHNVLAHEGMDGSTPAQRVTRQGYAWRVVGENVAAGPTTPAEVMGGWLASPAHCENLMDPRFSEMGIGWTVDARSDSGTYWTQVFAAPRRSR